MTQTHVTVRRTGFNIASGWVLHLITVVVNLFLVGYVVAKVGNEHYGGWTAIVSIIGYISLLDAGLSVALQHYIATHAAKRDKREMSETFSSAYVVYGSSAVLALLGCLVISWAYPTIFPRVPVAIDRLDGVI